MNLNSQFQEKVKFIELKLVWTQELHTVWKSLLEYFSFYYSVQG